MKEKKSEEEGVRGGERERDVREKRREEREKSG